MGAYPRSTVIFLIWILAVGSGAQEAPHGVPHQHIAAVVTPAESAVVGTIERFEQTERRLVLQTKDAQLPFILAADVVVRLGSRTLPVADLDTHRGRRAKVRFTQADGRRTAHWVTISSDPPRKTP
jgi:hypothetical protein